MSIISVSTKGLIFSKEKPDISTTLDKIKNGLFDFYLVQMEKLLIAEKLSKNFLSIKAFPKEKQQLFKDPEIVYYEQGLFHANLSFPSSLNEKGYEIIKISIILENKNEDPAIFAHIIGNDDIKQFNDIHHFIWLSMSNTGHSQEIISSILRRFGNQFPSYMVRNDSINPPLSSFKEIGKENIVKIGKSGKYLTENFIPFDKFLILREIENSETIKKIETKI